jgi:serine/threonine-protein kinase
MSALLGPPSLKPGDVVDGYRVVEKLGEGGFGYVFLVERDGERFAMKFAKYCPATGDEGKTEARGLREVVCMLQMDEHPNIRRALGFWRWPDRHSGWLCILLDYIEGDTLDVWAKRYNATPREVVRLFEKVASALDTAHGQGIFNRDLKPSNILVRAKDGEPIITDWGSGLYAMAKELTEGPVPPGTWFYRSPEARRFERENRGKSGARYEFKVTDDLFSVGVTMYEVLTGQEPALDTAVVPASKANPSVPQVLSDVVRKLIAQEPKHRYATAEALRRDLQRLAELREPEWDTPLPKPGASKDAPVAELKRAARFRRKRWVLGAIGLVGAAALVAGVALMAREEKPGQAAPQVQTTLQLRQSELQSPNPASRAVQSSSSVMASAASPTLLASNLAPLQKEPSSVKSTNATQGRTLPTEPKQTMSRAKLLAWCGTLSAAMALQAGCPASQVKPEPGECPQEAVEAMEENLGRMLPARLGVAIDKNQLEKGREVLGKYREGPVTGLVVGGGKGKLVEGTELHGRLWITDKYVIGRYTEAKLPDNTRLPVCIVLADPRAAPGFRAEEGSTPDVAVASREGPAYCVSRWP